MKRIAVEHLQNLSPVAVFFDIDGTLAPIELHPDLVKIESGVLATLHALNDVLHGAVGVLTGRSLEEADGLLWPYSFALAAEHGAAIRVGSNSVESVTTPSGDVASLYEQSLSAVQKLPGIRVERKRFGVALHYRAAPEYKDSVHVLGEMLAASLPYMAVLHGKMVVEVKPAEVNKGSALLRMMSEPPFRGRNPVFFGDDITDESAFREAQSSGGIGVRIGDAQTGAAASLPEQAALLPFLQQWLAALAMDR